MKAVGEEPLRYRWRRNGSDITHLKCAGIDTPTLTIPCFSPEHEGSYTCIVFNDKDAVKSDPAKLKMGKY